MRVAVVVRAHARRDAGHHPHPRLAEVERSADQGHCGFSPTACLRVARWRSAAKTSNSRSSATWTLLSRRRQARCPGSGLGKPMAEVATGKMAAPFTTLSSMVLSHAGEEGGRRCRSRPAVQVAGRQPEVDASSQAEGKAAVIGGPPAAMPPGRLDGRMLLTHHHRLGGAGAPLPGVHGYERTVRVESGQAPRRNHQGAPRRRHRRERSGADPQALRQPQQPGSKASPRRSSRSRRCCASGSR